MSKKNKSRRQELREKLSLPLIASPMFLVSTNKLAIATCKKGVVGSFPALNQRTSKDFEDWLKETNKELETYKKANPGKKVAPYAVNLIVHKTNPRLKEDLELCVKHKVPIIITSLGAVPDLVDKVHSYGGMVLHDVANVKHAKKAAAAGVDGIIAVAAGAGGHAGNINPITLVNEIRQFFDGIVVLAGGLSTGKDILTAEAAGADFAYMGTRFINTAESSASKDYKQMICDSKADDIVYTPAISGVPANFLRKSLENAGYTMEKIKKADSAGHKLKPLKEEAKTWKTIWSAGQGVGSIDDSPSVGKLVNRLMKEYQQAKIDLDRKTGNLPKAPKP
jgi:nitronate monooxygenase